MLFLQLVLLVVLLPGGDREDGESLGPEPISFQIILTTSFYSRSWTQNVGSAWLDELQTYGWDSDSGTFTCMWPWSRGNFSNKELMEEQRSFHTFSIRFPLIFQDHFSEWQLECEFSSLQGEMEEAGYMSFVSCLLEGKSLHCLLNLISLHFETELHLLGEEVEQVSRLFNQYHVINVRLQTHISDSCPPFLLGLLDAGKTHLQRQVRPEAWLSAGPSPGPGRLQLVCHVSGFYPKPVWVTWMRSEQEQQGTQLPHADGMWYRQVSLDVKVKETAGLSCWVTHSSLGGHEQPPSVGLVFLAVIVLLVFLAGLAWWLWKRCESLGPPSCSFPRVSPPFSVSSALLPPVPFPPEALPSTCCREIPPLFLPGKPTGDLSALASI
uniref:Ig-like domain-containing protein n=1 Tax=Canis lupus dingo TaxID=286419 RepID=A0A8C0L6T7_CANLU